MSLQACGAMLLATWVLATAASAQMQTTRASVVAPLGGTVVVALVENPSTGYRWRLSEADSADLAALAVADLGYGPGAGRGAPLVGAPGVRRFEIEGRRPGEARAVFVYARPWESGPPARRHVVAIRVR